MKHTRFLIITLTTLALALVLPLPVCEAALETVMVPMRDGIRLATDVHRPDGDGPWPAVLIRTPYNKDGVREFASEATKRGYALVAQDFRGRFASEGEDDPVFLHGGWGDHQDGYDTVEWIAQRDWSNGKVGGYGVSAPGIALNMMAPSRPPHLVCCYASVAFSSMYHQGAYQGGAFRRSLLEKWLALSGFGPKNLETFRAHPDYDDFWEQFDCERVAEKVNVPSMFVGGWYDIFSLGTLNSFTTVNQRGDTGARGKCRLVMEAYGHGRNDVLVFPNAGQPEAANVWNWFDIWLKHDGAGLEKIPTVQYFVMGDPNDPNTPGNQWRTAENWPVAAEAKKVYFHCDKRLHLAPPKDLFGSLSYRYDPQNPVPTIGGNNLLISKGPMDQRPVENRDDVLLFESPPMRRHVEITGPVTVTLWVSSTAPDTDFTAKLCDVYPDGRSMIVVDGILRARHRNSMVRNELMQPDKIYQLEIDLWATSLVFSPGHRVRVALSSSNAPRFEPNPNTGETAGRHDKAQAATNTIYMNADHPSHITFPVVWR
ncbi:MAG: CocE/NonD family hydrolase [Phycisphaerales bacterium]|nr:MAG: CocE/NonD family hydrolase [Phycisphaerales bacterium]